MANASISHVSEEEENYLRMDLMLSSISPRAVRVLFDKEFHPSCLEASIKKECGKLNDLKKKRVINAAHWNLLFPRSGVPNSTNFDVTLIATLIRNLTTLPTPSCGYDKLPLSTDTSATADLARIKYYRNKLAHINDGKLKSAVFASEWEDICGVSGGISEKQKSTISHCM
ncbi:unnamed protein product [Mytilus edulis]|uniref:DZIP3-like HEPN domain-containing protein n=1 Tax=Mytilus edulis TaxID=6550 RepID=A0A8S3RX86_MYTED|nr:unnamed protein product [Mytilus edulis]